MHFDSILIITYGRSGSTLLQGMLNSIPGVLIRGENQNFCFHLFKAYQAILKAKKQKGSTPNSPFFGAEEMDDQLFLARSQDMVRELLIGDHLWKEQEKSPLLLWIKKLKGLLFTEKNKQINCYGYKEIRYLGVLDELDDFLSFLSMIFPNLCFVLNTRNKDDVIKSAMHVKFFSNNDPENIQQMLEKAESAFFAFQAKHPENTFHITYEDVVGKTDKLRGLFSFLGASYDEEKLEKILDIRHSYKPAQEKIKALPNKR